MEGSDSNSRAGKRASLVTHKAFQQEEFVKQMQIFRPEREPVDLIRMEG